MKKTFPLHVPEKDDRRVLDAIKLEITKYVKRERMKTLPPEFNTWDFNCKVGSESKTATVIPLLDVPKAVDAVARAGEAEVYVEILASAGTRVKKSSSSYQRREP